MNFLITDVDRHRLSYHIRSLHGAARRGQGFGMLVQRLRGAASVKSSDIPATYVTMNSLVRLRYHSTGEVRDLWLVYPHGSVGADRTPDPMVDYVSVISPVGAALLGSQAGTTIEWIAPGGIHRGDVLAVVYQPEANGDPN